jgi:GGDEF domain-containing protein
MLCAIHPAPQPETISTELPLVELLAAIRRAERAQAQSETEATTGLYNRRGWTGLIEAEDARCRRHGHPA